MLLWINFFQVILFWFYYCLLLIVFMGSKNSGSMDAVHKRMSMYLVYSLMDSNGCMFCTLCLTVSFLQYFINIIFKLCSNQQVQLKNQELGSRWLKSPGLERHCKGNKFNKVISDSAHLKVLTILFLKLLNAITFFVNFRREFSNAAWKCMKRQPTHHELMQKQLQWEK